MIPTQRRSSLRVPHRLALALAGVIALVLPAACADNRGDFDGVTGRITTTLGASPENGSACAEIRSVWITITRVSAHSAAGSGPNKEVQWVDLVDLTAAPVQIDLLHPGAAGCLLATLGSRSALPAGRYERLRVQLLSNEPPGGTPTPSPNFAAPARAFNAVDHETEGIRPLDIGGADETGIEIPPDAITGGAIVLERGRTVNVDIRFDACRSVVQQADGKFRLQATVVAGAVTNEVPGVSGRVVDRATGAPIAGATITVHAETPGPGGAPMVAFRGTADPATGEFFLCPLPDGEYDLVVGALAADGSIAYGPTALFGIRPGDDAGDVPLAAQPGPDARTATVRGVVTATTASATAASIDVAVTLLVDAALADGSTRRIAAPILPGSSDRIVVEPRVLCPADVGCGDYALVVSAAPVATATFGGSGAPVYTEPALVDSPVIVFAKAMDPVAGGPAGCAPAEIETAVDAGGNPLVVRAGAATNAATIAFTGCSPP